jgi:hypothetical protein
MKSSCKENRIHNKNTKYFLTVSYTIIELGLFLGFLWAFFNSKYILAFLTIILWIAVYFGPAYLSDQKRKKSNFKINE